MLAASPSASHLSIALSQSVAYPFGNHSPNEALTKESASDDAQLSSIHVARQSVLASSGTVEIVDILTEGAIALSVTLSGDALFAS